MAPLPNDPLKGSDLPDPKLPDPLPDDGFENNMYTIIAIVAAILLVAFVVGVPSEVGQVSPPPAMP